MRALEPSTVQAGVEPELEIRVKGGSRDAREIGTSYSFKTQNLIIYHMVTLVCGIRGNVVCSIMSRQGYLVRLSVSRLVCQALYFTGAGGKHRGRGK